MENGLKIIRAVPEHDAALAELIRETLRSFSLDLPGTAYFDPGLDCLSRQNGFPGRAYFVLISEAGEVLGGAGYAECGGFTACAELQKLYLRRDLRGRGLGRALLRRAEEEARGAGYGKIYLETHTALEAALRLYERAGYRRIPRPPWAVHGAMDRFYLKEL